MFGFVCVCLCGFGFFVVLWVVFGVVFGGGVGVVAVGVVGGVVAVGGLFVVCVGGGVWFGVGFLVLLLLLVFLVGGWCVVVVVGCVVVVGVVFVGCVGWFCFLGERVFLCGELMGLGEA
ncbi:hypothetical protein [Pseudomonas syringae group genomosp. 7]|uniref:Uncharacterized protein n=1 Tax=Pseudomonas syringae pv. tagetis TaxID=129140 RepID=A0ABW7NVI3_9PSED